MKLLCMLGYHRKLVWRANPATENTEAQCRRCGKFIEKPLRLKLKRFR